MQAEHETEPYGHVGISREVEVDLEAVADTGGPAIDKADHLARCRGLVDQVEIGYEGVDDGGFLEQAKRKQGDANSYIVCAQTPVASSRQLRQHVVLANDRPCNELGKEGDE